MRWKRKVFPHKRRTRPSTIWMFSPAEPTGIGSVARRRRQNHDFLTDAFPNSLRESDETVWITQNALLGDEEDMAEIVVAIQKIQENARDLH